MIYSTVPMDESLTQGDLLDDCPLLRHDPPAGSVLQRGRVVVLTQACDLENAKATRVVVAVVHTADEFVRQGGVAAKTVRENVRFHKVNGLYFLPEAPAPIPVPESIVDLRDLHTLPRPLLDGLVAAGKRVARLAVPYREHLAQHFAVSYMRIALPTQYPTAP